jgi:hypothetical protein
VAVAPGRQRLATAAVVGAISILAVAVVMSSHGGAPTPEASQPGTTTVRSSKTGSSTTHSIALPTTTTTAVEPRPTVSRTAAGQRVAAPADDGTRVLAAEIERSPAEARPADVVDTPVTTGSALLLLLLGSAVFVVALRNRGRARLESELRP